MVQATERRHWTIRFSSDKDSFLVGVAWIPDSVCSRHGLNWPAVFATRRKARDMARSLVQKFAYLRPYHNWKFSPIRVTVSVKP